MKNQIQAAIDRAVEISGTKTSLAISLKQAPNVIYMWQKGLRPVPARHCSAIEKLSGGQVTRQELRPNDYWSIWPDLPKPAIPPTESAPVAIESVAN